MLFQNCTNCGQSVGNDSNFCNHCGVSLIQQYEVCGKCKRKNSLDAAFCGFCGTKMQNTEKLEKEYLGHWMRALTERIYAHHNSKNLDQYLNSFYESGFHKIFHSAAAQLSAEVTELLAADKSAAKKKTDQIVENRISDLLDYFIIHHCKDINVVPLSEKILKYQQLTTTDIPWLDFILAYLNMDSEAYPFHIDFIKMPVEHLKNASSNFLFPAKGERIWLIVDLSLLDTCKEGFALTEKALYWKAPFEKAQSVFFKDLDSLQIEEEWLLINKKFFNANPSLNLKLLYLLQKLNRLFGS